MSSPPNETFSIDVKALDEIKSEIARLLEEPQTELPCIFCDATFVCNPRQVDELEEHLLREHSAKIVNLRSIFKIKKCELGKGICFFMFHHSQFSNIPRSYLEAWKSHVTQNGTSSFSSQQSSSSSETGALNIGPHLNIDNDLRSALHLKHLNDMIELQSQENSAVSPRSCFACAKHTAQTAKDLCSHLYDAHGFSIGLITNIVHLPTLLDILQIKLNHLQCIYCEKVFRNTRVLREHIRKKKHLKINKRNPLYHRFYIANYSNHLNSFDDVHSNFSIKEDHDGNFDDHDMDGGDYDEEEENLDEPTDDDNWKDWEEDDQNEEPVTCLFCPSQCHNALSCFNHMKQVHFFDFYLLKEQHKLNPYHSIALLNYIRRKTLQSKCFTCDLEFLSNESLLEHFKPEHFAIDLSHPLFSEPELLVPVIPNDLLLTGITDGEDDDDIEYKDSHE